MIVGVPSTSILTTLWLTCNEDLNNISLIQPLDIETIKLGIHLQIFNRWLFSNKKIWSQISCSLENGVSGSSFYSPKTFFFPSGEVCVIGSQQCIPHPQCLTKIKIWESSTNRSELMPDVKFRCLSSSLFSTLCSLCETARSMPFGADKVQWMLFPWQLPCWVQVGSSLLWWKTCSIEFIWYCLLWGIAPNFPSWHSLYFYTVTVNLSMLCTCNHILVWFWFIVTQQRGKYSTLQEVLQLHFKFWIFVINKEIGIIVQNLDML
jgi:hypothetical protein